MLTLIPASPDKELSSALLGRWQLKPSRTVATSAKHSTSAPWQCMLLGLLPFADVTFWVKVVIMTDDN